MYLNSVDFRCSGPKNRVIQGHLLIFDCILWDDQKFCNRVYFVNINILCNDKQFAVVEILSNSVCFEDREKEYMHAVTH